MTSELYKRIFTSLFLIIFVVGMYSFFSPLTVALIWSAVLVYILFFEWPQLIPKNQKLFWLITPLYPILPFMLFIFTHVSSPQGPTFAFWLIALVSLHDTGSYFFGTLFGKHLLAPNISPKKTWEGFWGGYLVTTIAFLAAFFTYGSFWRMWVNLFILLIKIVFYYTSVVSHFLLGIQVEKLDLGGNFAPLLLIIIIALFNLGLCASATTGDLFESWLKRRVGIKDSGALLPGHGGLLDRLDGILFAVMYLFLIGFIFTMLYVMIVDTYLSLIPFDVYFSS